MAKKTDKIVQINNRYIKENQDNQRRIEAYDRKQHRFMGGVMILVILLFTLPTYNLFHSYQNLKNQRKQLDHLKKDYSQLLDEVKEASTLATKLQDEDYAAKYVRAKYSYSKDGEFVYTIPELVPK